MVIAPTLTLPAGVSIGFGSSLKETARLRKAPFGDGYMQRSRDGRNHIAGSYSVTIENLTRDESVATIRAFLRERGGDLPFYFTPPGESTPRLWTCEDWTRTHVGAIHDSISTTFDEQFDS